LHPLTRIDFIGPRTVFIASHLVIIRIIHIIVFYDIGSLRTFSLPWVTLPSLCIFSRMGSHRHDQTPHREKRSRYSRRLTHDNIRNTIAVRPCCRDASMARKHPRVTIHDRIVLAADKA
jgi:hypothetical protein